MTFKFPSPIIGILMTAALLVLLGLSRLLVPVTPEANLEIREIEITSLPEPPPPPPEEPPPDAPPPPPSLTQISHLPDPSRIPVPKVDTPLNLDTPIDPFFTDVEPSPLPQPIVRKAPKKRVVKPPTKKRPKATPKKTKPRPKKVKKTKPKPKKSHYGIGELDRKPRVLRHGSAVFPKSLSRKGITRGTVVLEVELSTKGRVKIRKVVSATHRELVSSARRVASSARFTRPTINGQPVKAIMRWPVTIKK